MIRTQIQLPDDLYRNARRVADRREISLAELVRRGLEYMIAVSAVEPPPGEWSLPKARRLGGRDPFRQPGWRAELHLSRLGVAEESAAYGGGKRGRRKTP